MFWYHSNSMMNREGTKGALFYVGPRFRSFVCYGWKILNNMLFCVKIMLIYVCVM